MVVTERPGRIRIVDGRRLDPEPLAEIPTVVSGETGLLGIAVPHDVEEDPAVYAFATEADGASNSVWRVPLEGGTPARVITGLPASLYHNGGGLVFGTDGKLYVSNGETHESERSQDPRALGGKIYRYNPDGSVPGDNPFGDSPAFAIGLRNPFGVALDPRSEHIWATENGPDSFDEINHITQRGNFGWPEVSGPGCGNCIDPVLAYESIIVPTGIAFAGPDAPPRYRGDMFFGAYAEATIHRVELNATRDEATRDEVFLRSDEPVIAVAWGPGGLYYSTPTSVKMIALKEKPKPSSSEPSAESPEKLLPTPSSGSGAAPTEPTSGNSAPWVAIVALALVAGGLVALRTRLHRRTDQDQPPV